MANLENLDKVEVSIKIMDSGATSLGTLKYSNSDMFASQAELCCTKDASNFCIMHGDTKVDEFRVSEDNIGDTKGTVAEILSRSRAAFNLQEAFTKQKELSGPSLDAVDSQWLPSPPSASADGPTPSLEAAVAQYAVQRAGVIAGQLQERLKNKSGITKGDASPVTVADFTVQAIVHAILSLFFPEDGFISEESSDVLLESAEATKQVVSAVQSCLGTALNKEDICKAIDLGSRGSRNGRCWVLDPVDGTKGFIRGEQFCIALGFMEEGIPRFGVLGCPNLPEMFSTATDSENADRGLLFSAETGKGAWMRPMKSFTQDWSAIEMREISQISDSVFCESAESSHSLHEVSAEVAQTLGISIPPVRLDSQCKYGILARGEADIYLRLPKPGYVENIWDHCAGSVVVKEAGGQITDICGRELDFSLGSKLPSSVTGIVVASTSIQQAVQATVEGASKSSAKT